MLRNSFTLFLFTVILFLSTTVSAQVHISGKVMDDKGNPLFGVSVSLDNTLDGGTTDSAGRFDFTTTEKGNQTIVATAVGYSSSGMPLNVDKDITNITLKVKNTAKTLEEVSITAGAFEASNDKDKTVLKPLDIVTTAGAQADVIKAIETLPGVQKQGAQNGLFVRGGDANEASYLIDGLVVQNAFFSGPPGVSTRSRFGAFQFKGVSFSSGGYSARYGQALSSVLELNSLDLPEQSTINLGINMAGAYASGSKLWEKGGGSVTAYYNNLQPFYGLVKTNFDFYDVPKGYGGSARYAWQPSKNSILKVNVAGSQFKSGIGIPNPYEPDQKIRYGLQNNNYTSMLSFKHNFSTKFSVYAATGYSYNEDQSTFDTIPGMQKDQRAQARLEGKYYINAHLNILVGTELQHYEVDNKFLSYKRAFTENMIAGYAEIDYTPVYWLAIKPGIRYEKSELLNKSNFAPRIAMAIKAGKHAQVSLAGGIFYQLPDYLYLYTIKPYNQHYDYQKAVHYIANYQWQKGDRTLRVETYYKDYQSLIRERLSTGPSYNANMYRTLDSGLISHTLTIDNSGYGYATGAELFWRDKKTFKNTDYWISYSYIDTRRLYKNYLAEATPDFIATNNLNIVAKYWINKINTQINATYSYASGRPYYDPNATVFLGDRSPEYHNLSFTVNHLRSFKKWFMVFYAGIDNVTNHKNVFGYRYSSDGTRTAIQPPLYRSYFAGINMSLTKFDKDEL